MIDLRAHADLSALNTFRLPGSARWLATVDSADELAELVCDRRFAGMRRIVLGGGSNLVLRGGEINALLIRMGARAWRAVAQTGNRVVVEADAGMGWHDLVTACVAAGYGGIENLALIPGTVGAAPVQNIGAYGVELNQVLHSVDAVHLQTGTRREFLRDECRFGYRDSIFKHEAVQYAIVRVRLDLATDAPLVLGYRDLRDELLARGNPPLNRRIVYDMVCAIRSRKLPDPDITGNVGSFFKNPVIPAAQFASLQQRFPDIVGYPQASGDVKVAAGWLIDHSGWKGRREGCAGVHERHALVLINLGGATGSDVLALAWQIVEDIRVRYGIALELEPQLL